MSKKTEVEVVQSPRHAVIYTDGGCKPSRGIGGWGVHGYIHNEETPKQGSGCKTAVLTKKGYQLANAKAVSVTACSYIDGFGSLIPESTNNEAELVAAINAFDYVLVADVVSVLFLMDSKYVINGITEWVYKWSANNWCTGSGEPVANVERWKTLLESKKRLEAAGIKIKIDHVDGHSGDLGNDTADELASTGIVIGRKGIQHHEMVVSEAKGYWTRSCDYNRMFSLSRWYFNTHSGSNRAIDGRHVYYIGDHGSDDELYGKPQSDTAFAVLYLKEAEKVLEAIRSEQDVVDRSTFNNVIIGRLDNIFNPDQYNEILASGPLKLQRATANLDLYTADEVPLTRELRPARLAYNAFDGLTMLEGNLVDFISDPSGKGITVTDITDLLYDVDASKKKPVSKLKPSITSNTRAITVDANYDTGSRKGVEKLTLTVGVDIAKRNTLAALASSTPKVSLATWRESDSGFRYATIIDADGDIGIWAGIYSNIRVLKP